MIKLKFFLLFFLLVYGGNFVYSQKNIASVDVTLGVAQNGFGGSIDYNAFFSKSRDNYLQGGILATVSSFDYNEEKIDYNLFTFSLNYFHQVVGNRSGAFKVYLGAGLTGGYEYVNNGETVLPNGALISTKSDVVYGLNGGVDADIYMNDYFSFVVRLREYWHVYSEIGTLTYYAGAGVKYYFN